MKKNEIIITELYYEYKHEYARVLTGWVDWNKIAFDKIKKKNYHVLRLVANAVLVMICSVRSMFPGVNTLYGSFTIE